VHGDYHLGQVLRSGNGRGYVLDFEGEPQAAAAEKTRPDLALRDVAGMLRSFDYAASVGGASKGWVRSARERLVAGYEAESGAAADVAVHVLLRALELDKAMYEVVYESGHRPDWLPIPLEGVDRLLAG
jgi:maltokinase